MWWEAVALGANAIGAASKYAGMRDAAYLTKLENIETLRRFKEQAKATMSQARAAGAASGVEFESQSTQTVLAKMQDEFRRQAEWLRTAGARRAGAMSSAAGFGLVSDLGSSMFQFGAANNWWK